MSIETVNFVTTLASEFPELRAAYNENVEDNHGEVLPHLIIADFCRLVQSAQSVNKWHNKFFDFLEEHFSAKQEIPRIDNDTVRMLISVSFIEHLPFCDEQSHWTILCLGENMRADYDNIFGLD